MAEHGGDGTSGAGAWHAGDTSGGGAGGGAYSYDAAVFPGGVTSEAAVRGASGSPVGTGSPHYAAAHDGRGSGVGNAGAQRHGYAVKYLYLVAAIDSGRVQQIIGYAEAELSQHEDPEGTIGTGYPQAGKSVEQAQAAHDVPARRHQNDPGEHH